MIHLIYIALVMLTLFAFSAGATAKANRSAFAKPELTDLLLVSSLWIGGFVSLSRLPWNRWLILFCLVALAHAIGQLRGRIQSRKSAQVPAYVSMTPTHNTPAQSAWAAMARRSGIYQTHFILSLFYFIFVMPFWIIVHFRDPLGLRRNRQNSHWQDKSVQAPDLTQARRQF